MKAYNNKIRVGLDITFIVLGLLFLTGYIVFPAIDLWVQLLVVLIGVLFSSLPEQNMKSLGFGVMLFGVYLIMRTTGIISSPILLWVFGVSLVLIGVLNLLRGKKTPNKPTPEVHNG